MNINNAFFRETGIIMALRGCHCRLFQGKTTSHGRRKNAALPLFAMTRSLASLFIGMNEAKWH